MAEKEYIEREAVLAYMSEVKAACITNFEYEASAVIEGMIGEIKDDEIPAADVEPVRHGKWIYNPNGMDFNLGAWECSICTQKNNNLPCSRNISPYICVGSKYCPNCGARMCGEIK